ncbi:MAG: exodeoxyribonuclease VII large subunit [Lewinellaceae bacterium]|jgi:exodeoxyribonuclease VII large subunit|nr:exodeoxyribonuclease VII large subunit [Lewinellaceae bacterium]
MHVYNLFDLNEHIRRVMALNFQQPLWITAEIAQSGQSRGHYYLDLVQKGEGDDLLAQAQAVLWASDYRRLYKQLGPQLDALLREGLEMKMQVRVDFHERFGFKLLIADIDPAHTFGQLDLQRRETVRTLRERGLLDRNRNLPLPAVLQRIAVITSAGAAGFQDFREHLAHNAFGYTFDCRLFEASVQGKNARAELCAALERVAAQSADFDCLVVVRGGGARLDLAAFDGLDLGEAVAQMPLPVLTGIGHDIDETVLDMVAHAALKTPTAVADFLLQHNLFFENGILRLAEQTRQAGAYCTKTAQLTLQQLEATVRWSARERLLAAGRNLDAMQEKIPETTRQLLHRRALQLDQAATICQAFDPEKVLQRGYSITMKDGKIISRPSDAIPGDVLETRLAGGKITSRV